MSTAVAASPPPKGWPRISSVVCYQDPHAAIDWLCRVFGFEVRLKVEGEGGRIEHSELELGGGLIMVSGAGEKYLDAKGPWKKDHASPTMVGGKNTQCMCVHIDDVDAHHARVRAAGAKVYMEPKTSDYGEDYWSDRSYGVHDLEGHQWWFMQRMRTGNAK